MKKTALFIMSALLVLGAAACSGQNNRMSDSISQPENSTIEEDNRSTNETQESSRQPIEMLTEESEKDLDTEMKAEMGKTLVVYYSASGHTETVAEYIADATNAELFKLLPVNPYSDSDLDWTDDSSRVVYEHENPDNRDVDLAETTVSDWDSYTTVFIGYPIWWGIAAWPVDSFIKANDFSGKTVIPFCTSASSGLGESGELLKEAAGSGNWLEGERFSSGSSKETVQDWVDNLGL